LQGNPVPPPPTAFWTLWLYFHPKGTFSLRVELKKKEEIKLNSVVLVRERTIPTERLLLVAKLVPKFPDKGCLMFIVADPNGRNLGSLDQSRYFFFQVAPQL
jgi:hypothetical protein